MVNSQTVMITAGYVPVQLSIDIYPGSGVPWVQSVWGLLLDMDGIPIEGKTVRLVVNGSAYGTGITLTDGSYGFFGVAVGEGAYTFLAIFDGDGTYSPSSAEASASFQKLQAALSMDVSPASGYIPLAVAIQGYLTRPDTGAGLGGRAVRIYKDNALLAEVPTSVDPGALGYYWLSDTIADINTHAYYTQFPGDDQFLGCEESEAAERSLGTLPAVLLPAASMFLGAILVAAGR